METDGSLLGSQGQATCPYNESDKSNPFHPIYPRSFLIFSSQLYLGIQSGLSPPDS